MNSKAVPFLLGLLLGVTLCGLVLGRRNSSPPVPTALDAPEPPAAELKTDLANTRSRLERADAENIRLTARVEELARERDGQETPTAKASETPEQNFLAAMFGGDGTNGISSAMSDMIKESMQLEIENRILALMEKLILSAEQEAAIRKILTGEIEQGLQMAQQMLKGELKPEEFASLNNETNRDDQIKALLTPEQAAAYDTYQKEENVRAARLQANSELLQMQASLSLTEEQQDKVFAVLYNQAQEGNSSADFDFTSGTNSFQLGLERKVEALRPVLTPEQLNRYQKQQEQQLKLIEAFMPKGDTNASGFPPGVGSIHFTPAVVPK